jgi:hypothetical protein
MTMFSSNQNAPRANPLAPKKSFMDNMSNPGMAALSGGASSIGAGIGSLFSNYQNPADSAKGYLDKIPETLRPYFEKYINAGNQALPQLQGQYGEMLDPNAFIKKIGQGFTQSPGYQFQLNQGEQAATNAARAGGMAGSPEHQQNAAGIAEGLANQDFYNYLKTALGVNAQGTSGLSDIYHTGAESGIRYGEDLGDIMGQQANLAYEGTNAENQHDQGEWGDIFGGVASILPYLLMAG